MNTINYNAQLDEDMTIVVSHDLPTDYSQAVTQVRLTIEGIILDFFEDGELNATIGMTYQEWFDLAESMSKQ
jgi:hypothetical protein